MPFFKQPMKVSAKDDDSPVTAADMAADECIRMGLIKRFGTDISVVSEESRHGVDSDGFWLVDPLDGTRSFIAGSPEFTVNIAWIQNQRPQWGVIYAPALNQTWWGGPGYGAFADGRPIRAVTPQTPLRVVASKNHLTPQTADYLQRLPNHRPIHSGSSLKFCELAMGRADLYPRLGPCCEWDTAAGEAILIGAGGRICDFAGQLLRYGKPDPLNPWFLASGQADPRDYLPQAQDQQ